MIRFKNDEEIAKLVESIDFGDRKKTDTANFSKLLREMVEKALDEATPKSPIPKGQDPDAIKQIENWVENNKTPGTNQDLELITKTNGDLHIKVPAQPDGQRGDRVGLVRKMIGDTEGNGPLAGFEFSPKKSSVGHFVSKGYKYTTGAGPDGKGVEGATGRVKQTLVYIKDAGEGFGGAKAARGGMAEEVAFATAISQKYKQQGITAKTAGAGHGSDLTISAEGKEDLTIEVKTSLGADFGQFRMRYNIAGDMWEETLSKEYMKVNAAVGISDEVVEPLFETIFVEIVAPYMNARATGRNFPKKWYKDPALNVAKGWVTGLKGGEGTSELKQIMQNKWFRGKTDVQIPYPFERISKYYVNKGDRFIQIKGKGLYALNDADASGLGVPNFATSGLKSYIRMRIKPSGGANSSHGFVVAIKLSGDLPDSKLDLRDPRNIDKLVAYFAKTS